MFPYALKCRNCGESVKSSIPWSRCQSCGSLAEYVFDLKPNKASRLTFKNVHSMWRYSSLLPEVEKNKIVSMGEGFTPLNKASRLGRELEISELYLKDETRNPTGSFRDRAASLIVSNALMLGYKSLVCASNGNMGASLAAYSAKASLSCQVVVPRRVDEGKLAQMLIYDANIQQHGDYVDDAIEKVEAIAKETGWYQATPELNALTIEAQKTIAYELFEQMKERLDLVIAPMGSGSSIYSLWKGFKELQELGLMENLPKIVGVQAESCAPIVEAFQEKGRLKVLRNPETKALAILVKNPLMGKLALDSLKESGGMALATSDFEIFQAEKKLARLEGIFVEPSSASTISAAAKIVEEGLMGVGRDTGIVCLLTGSGLKAPEILDMLAKRRRTTYLRPEVTMKTRILEILEEGETHGYDLWKKLGEVVSLQAVYQHLSELEKKGLVVGRLIKERKLYCLTKKGRRILEALKELRSL